MFPKELASLIADALSLGTQRSGTKFAKKTLIKYRRCFTVCNRISKFILKITNPKSNKYNHSTDFNDSTIGSLLSNGYMARLTIIENNNVIKYDIINVDGLI